MISAKYDKIGDDYNLTRRADPYLTQRLIALLAPQPGGFYLDIGCGTGNYTCAMAQQGFRFMGIDPSTKMLAKANTRNPNLEWRLASAEATGLQADLFHGAMGTLTIHHWKNLEEGFRELSRVLKPQSKIVIFTSTPTQMRGYWLNHYFPQMMQASLVQMPSLEDVTSAMQNAGLSLLGTEAYFVQPDLADQFLYCGKENPEMYFQEQIRNGISSFSALANRSEVEKGMAQLRKDIDEAKVKSIMESYENQDGDYLFIIGQTPAG